MVTCGEISAPWPAGERDKDYHSVVERLKSGLPAARGIAHPAGPYKNVWHRLSLTTDSHILLDSKRLIPPTPQRRALLHCLHSGHPGITRMKKHARALYFWPGMTKDIEDMVDKCEPCQSTRPATDAEAPQAQDKPNAPMDAVSLDLFDFADTQFIVMVIRYSGWYDVFKLSKLDSAAIIKLVQRWTDTFGLPLSIMTNGGPQWRAPVPLSLHSVVGRKACQPYHV